MTKSLSTIIALESTTIVVENDGFIADSTDWDYLALESDSLGTGVVCRVTSDGYGDYGLEYYYCADARIPDPRWGSHYGDSAPYRTPDGPAWMFRRGQRVRFYNSVGEQVGPEQRNVCPAVAYALVQGWISPLDAQIKWMA